MNNAKVVLSLIDLKIYQKKMAQMVPMEGKENISTFKDFSKVPAYLALSELYDEIHSDEDIKRLVEEE